MRCRDICPGCAAAILAGSGHSADGFGGGPAPFSPVDHGRARMETGATRPGDLDGEELRRVGARVVEAIATYHAGLERRAVLPPVTPEEVADHFRGELPEGGEAAESLVEDWRERVAPLLTAVGSSRH